MQKAAYSPGISAAYSLHQVTPDAQKLPGPHVSARLRPTIQRSEFSTTGVSPNAPVNQSLLTHSSLNRFTRSNKSIDVSVLTIAPQGAF